MFSKVFCTAVLAMVSYVAVPTLNIIRLNAERASTSEGRRLNMQRLVSTQAADDIQPVAADIATSLLDLLASSSRTVVRTDVMPVANPFPESSAEQVSLTDVMYKLDQLGETQRSQDKLLTNLETAQNILSDLVADLNGKSKRPVTYGGVLSSLSNVKATVAMEDAAAKLKSNGVCECGCDCMALIARIEALEAKVTALSNVSSPRLLSGGGSTGSVTPNNVYYSNPTVTYSTTGGGSTGSVQANPYVQSVVASPAVSNDARVRVVEPRRVTRADVHTATTPTYIDEFGAPTSGQCVQNADGTYSCPQSTGYSTQTTSTPRSGLLGFGLLGRRR